MYDFITNRLMFDHKEEKGILLTKEVVENFFVENDINIMTKQLKIFRIITTLNSLIDTSP